MGCAPGSNEGSQGVITLDTSAILAALNVSDPAHRATVEAVAPDKGPRIVPAFILSEVAFMLESRGHTRGLISFLCDLSAGRLFLRCGEADLPRIGILIERYADMPLGLSDAAVVACAEQNGKRVLTLDRRHFDVVSAEGTIEVVG